MSHKYQVSFYRTSQYDNLEEAKQKHGIHHAETTYGITSTIDSFINMRAIMDCYDTNLIHEYRFIWTIDDVRFPEMSYGKSVDLLDASSDDEKLKNFLASDLQPA